MNVDVIASTKNATKIIPMPLTIMNNICHWNGQHTTQNSNRTGHSINI